MRLGKVQASGYVAEAAEEELTPEPATLAPATPEPAASGGRDAEREQAVITG